MFSRHLAAGPALVVLVAVAPPVHADGCRTLRFTFQPECFHAPGGVCGPRKVNDQKLDLPPQIAVWIESADGAQFIDSALVTSGVAVRGLGNRPGRWDFLSSPKFPYGKRAMALPVWAHRRGKLYDTVVFQDDEPGQERESWLGWHEPISSPDPYYCRPMQTAEIDVDAVSCPTATFNSAKGRLEPSLPRVFYPPRNDLTAFSAKDCDQPIAGGLACPGTSAMRYSALNDLDAVAAATPPVGKPYSGTWTVPAALPMGNYAVFVEVGKEFDDNAFHQHPAYEDSRLLGYGLGKNFGQPSVVYRVPIRLDGEARAASVSTIAGYGDWTGQTGDLTPQDGSITTGVPGSGEGRLGIIDGPAGMGRVQVAVEACMPMQCDPLPAPPDPVTGVEVPTSGLGPDTVQLRFVQTGDGGKPVVAYEIRYRASSESGMTEEEFGGATPVMQVAPEAPGLSSAVLIDGLKPETSYVAGIRAVGRCMTRSPLSFVAFRTTVMKFRQLSGCFVATAAWGSTQDKELDLLRRLRDRGTRASALGAAAVDAYYRSAPAPADVLARSSAGRALVRAVLGPVARLAGGVDALAAGLR